MDEYLREGARRNAALLRKMQGQPEPPATAVTKHVCISELLAAWDMAHDSLTAVADAAKKCGHLEFAREAETIADSLESRVTALSNIAKGEGG